MNKIQRAFRGKPGKVARNLQRMVSDFRGHGFAREETPSEVIKENNRQLARFGRILSENEPGTLPREYQKTEHGKVRKNGYLLNRGPCMTDVETAVSICMLKGKQ